MIAQMDLDYLDPKEWIEFLTWVHLLEVAKMKAVNRNNDNINKNKDI